MQSIDLNSDLGESFGPWRMGRDSEMLALISSANIACGFHAGDPAGLLDTLREAAQRGVSVGAHVGYRDLVGFGRRAMDIGDAELTADVIYQIGALQGLARAVGTRVSYVKPHGALYNTIARDSRQAACVIAAIRAIDPGLVLVALAGSPLIEQAQLSGLTVVSEVFADRNYIADGALVARRVKGSVLHDPELIAQRVLRMVTEGRVTAVDGTDLAIKAQSICVHGDTPAAVAITARLREVLLRAGVLIEPFCAARSDHD
ncbi:5-oxoprolinase subunit PxpA [Gemmobacter sp.]|uniref:LamB/YcsF family protein n=1 Tax=Gemmobacter sp. TaxID=1898957 RepID=UPI002AFF99E1|nr:5-oxoprolinase subunit PxpA [Gemmobacter sp.]